MRYKLPPPLSYTALGIKLRYKLPPPLSYNLLEAEFCASVFKHDIFHNRWGVLVRGSSVLIPHKCVLAYCKENRYVPIIHNSMYITLQKALLDI